MKRQKLNRKVLYIILCLVVVSIASITLAYAALSSALNISGSTEVTGSTWNITINKVNLNERFPNSVWLTGEYGEEITGNHDDNSLLCKNGKLLSSGKISGTSINDIQVSFSRPGDAVVSVYEIVNNGSIPAILDSITENNLTISSSSNNSNDIQLISQFFSTFGIISYKEKIKDNGVPDSDYAIDLGEVLCPGKAFYIIFMNEFNSSATSVPSSNVTISNIGATLNFIQADKSTCIES